MKRRMFSLTAIALTLAAGGAHAQTKWDLPSAYQPTDFHVENLNLFAQDVDKATAGKLKITVHINSSLFKAPEIKRAVQGNQAQIGEILLANFQNEWQIFGVDGLPFVATSYDAAWKLYQAQKPFLEKKLSEQGMTLLYTVPWPPQGLYSKNPVAKVEDLKGSKWRAYSPATARIAELVGAQPVTVQSAELSQAMATGVVESFMTSGATGYATKTYEYIKNFYDTQAWLPKNAIIVNNKAFAALSKDEQAAVLKAAASAESRGWAMSKQKTKDYTDLLQKNGMRILEPSAQLKAGFAKVGDTMLKEWIEKAGPDGKALIDAYRKP
ncbi:TRAP transporter substrate-binding protein [Ramlibacter sp. H39-3-26]|uniref:TRAP transporter substrate-binding protein n=1 Tax=Curvibacter soli TaxID=3031331 RepID=UPI0023D9ADAF|nr:TRAP transporter substrate-binding protein [Ramlibacter sp. H39-3-26]MDF1485732.1 TRAP transporter substrate-binding protein [Ramlibacter sp. H39-3-26]